MIYYLEFLLTPTFPALHLLSIFLGSIYWYGLCTEMCSTDPGLRVMSAPAAFEIEMHFHLHPVLPQ